MTVKKWLVGLMVLMFILGYSWSADARLVKFGIPVKGHDSSQGVPQDDSRDNPQPNPDSHRNRALQNDCRYIIHRTAGAIIEAQRAAERGHRSFGLARAVFAQQRARELYTDGNNYQDAIFFSLRARRSAIAVIKANRMRVRPDFFPDRLESKYDHRGPSDDELDHRMNGDHDGKKRMGRDDDAVHIRIELDL